MKNKIIRNIKKIYLSIFCSIIIAISNIQLTFASSTGDKFKVAFNDLSSFIKKITSGMLAFSILSGIAVIIYHVVQLALVGGNPNERSKVLKNLLTSIVCIGLLGSIGLIIGLIASYTGLV